MSAMQFQAVVFDFDSTVVNTETFELLAEEALRNNPRRDEILTEFQSITNLGMAGDIALEESFRRRMELVSLNRTHVEAVMPKMLTHLSPSFSEHRDFFEMHADKCFIVSGGFTDLIYPVSDALKIPREHVFANQFVFDEHGAVVGIDTTRPTCKTGGKAQQILSLQLPQPAVMVGDGMTDYEAKHLGGVGTFIAYTEFSRREKVCALADRCAHTFKDVLEYIR